jgi:hypothetical protein
MGPVGGPQWMLWTQEQSPRKNVKKVLFVAPDGKSLGKLGVIFSGPKITQNHWIQVQHIPPGFDLVQQCNPMVYHHFLVETMAILEWHPIRMDTPISLSYHGELPYSPKKNYPPYIPSSKHTKKYGKSPFLMEKLTISMAMFNSYFDITRPGNSPHHHRATGHQACMPSKMALPPSIPRSFQLRSRWVTVPEPSRPSRVTGLDVRGHMSLM